MPMHRTETLERLDRTDLDLLVIGAGIVGARIAYEAARAGLAVALVDAGDFGGGTSSASSKLVHGGFRYLPMGDVGLIRQSQRERRLLLEVIAPNLVRRMPFLLPAYTGSSRGPVTLAAGLLLYRALAGRGGRIDLMSPEAALEQVPPLRARGLRMCGVFEEAETIDSRLVLATVKAAALAGALVLNHAKVTGVELRHNRGGAAVIDAGPDGRLGLRARSVINAAGPWVDHVRRLDDPGAQPLVRLSKGVHLLLPMEDRWSAGVALPLPGGRVSLGIPWQGMLMLGTTDTLFEGDPSRVEVTQADTSTVLEEASGFLDGEQLRPERVRCRIAGLRALPITDGDTAVARRGHLVETSRDGLISVAGGKLTTHRLIAIDALRRVPDHRLEVLGPCCSQLPGTGWSPRFEAFSKVAPDVADHLERLYGEEAVRVLGLAARIPGGFSRMHPAGPDIWAQAAYAIESEWARGVDDIARRRTTLSVRGLLTEAIAERLAALVGDGGRSSAAAGDTSIKGRQTHHSRPGVGPWA
jgi:glycerol-3-phosphate dehydrogenase